MNNLVINKFVKQTAVMAALLCVSLSVHAHRGWILPAATVLSSDDPWVTFDAAISNDIFHADYAAMRVAGVAVQSPAGNSVELLNVHSGKHRTTFDLNLKERGTFKVYSASSGLRARWETAEGQRRGWPGRGESYTPEGFAANVPAQAKNLQVTQFSRRMETFITAGAPSNQVLKATGEGIELLPITHPNDLFAGEQAEFQLLIDGQPAVGAKVEIIPDGMRYRDAQDAIELESDSQGKIRVTWPRAGMYWLNASYSDERAKAPATQRTGDYTAVFEVLPQ